MYYIYLLRCDDQSLYCGITTDYKRRYQEHVTKSPKAAKYTKAHTVIALECVISTSSRVLASQLEYKIKQLTKKQKEELIAQHTLQVLQINETDYSFVDSKK